MGLENSAIWIRDDPKSSGDQFLQLIQNPFKSAVCFLLSV